MADMLRHAPLPVFDAKKDGNPFRWVVAIAPKVRAARQHACDNQAYERWWDRAAARLPVQK
ncbi:MAG TPA: hypothetical protein VGF12_07055 [Roseateles sp.]|uniref:hypothetical protein n=1 Tax=Roseateles sp. TaxID=1971397 RepID=UPI002EDAE059